ncbi:holo-ACP synthase [Desertivibrio insolitus]|uniref:holo-ACP synthase n=1 Tax=Herbiconiux sp. SYSU D00978 TaxID=2812562 RepID=UPI001A9762A4|nr:holo-ACP synthase [Herbiconiux sp. SYSU D00978]
MIVGIGVDVVDLARFDRAMTRTPALRERLFAPAELARPRSLHSLAARFAAKEAVMKALGDGTGIRWHDMIVSSDDEGAPSLALSGAAQERADARGITDLHLSLSHDGGVAIAYVIAEAR